MITNETPEKETRKQVPMSFILAGVAALLLLMAIFFTNDTGSKIGGAVTAENKMAEEIEIVSTNMLLHSQFSKLQKLDEEFNTTVFNNGSPASIDSANRLVEQQEKLFTASIDSINKNKQKYNAWSNVVMIDSITNTFTNALANRKYLADIRSSLEGKTINMGAEQKEIMKLETDIRKKNSEIAALENLLKSPAVVENRKQSLSAKEKEIQTALKEEEMRNAGLLDIITDLKNDNAKLASENKLKKTDNTQADAMVSAKNKMQELENEISDLNAELSFARIDCNLSRADAKKIISNSKQRMQLLEESLKSLQTLAGSDNLSIKRKAKEKLAELSSIASTVRD